MIHAALAKHLTGLGIVDYHDDGTVGGDCFLDHMPPEPDAAVSITLYGGIAQPSSLPYDLPTVQIRTRGAKHDPVAPLVRIDAIYAALACLDGVTLDEGGADEVHLVGCTAALSASSTLGVDDNDRHERVQNFDLHVHSPTTNRPAISA